MAEQYHKQSYDWERVLYDFTDNLVEPNNTSNDQIFNHLLFSTSNYPHHSFLPVHTQNQFISDFKTNNSQESPDIQQQALKTNEKNPKTKKRNNLTKTQLFQTNISLKQTSLKLSLQQKQQSQDLYLPQSSPKGWKQRKQSKQYIYSKNYREKKKQQLKVLQQENAFLHKKIQQLQLRVCSAQTQLNKLKHSFQEKDKTVMQLNHMWISKIQQLLNSSSTTEQDLYKEFANSYDDFGFAGKQKIQKLHYHMNEFLENVLKDSEQYMALTVINNIGLLGDSPDENFPQINYTIFQIMQYDEHKLQTVKKFIGPYLKPSMENIQKSCQKLYENFQQVFTQIYQTHEYLKVSKNKDFLTIKQRLQMESWFQENKYSKELRKLRSDWENSIKNSEDSNDFQFVKKKVNFGHQ